MTRLGTCFVNFFVINPLRNLNLAQKWLLTIFSQMRQYFFMWKLVYLTIFFFRKLWWISFNVIVCSSSSYLFFRKLLSIRRKWDLWSPRIILFVQLSSFRPPKAILKINFLKKKKIFSWKRKKVCDERKRKRKLKLDFLYSQVYENVCFCSSIIFWSLINLVGKMLISCT